MIMSNNPFLTPDVANTQVAELAGVACAATEAARSKGATKESFFGINDLHLFECDLPLSLYLPGTLLCSLWNMRELLLLSRVSMPGIASRNAVVLCVVLGGPIAQNGA